MNNRKLTPEFIKSLEEFNSQELPTNVLKFDQSKRRKPLVKRVYTELAQVIDLNHFRATRTIKEKVS